MKISAGPVKCNLTGRGSSSGGRCGRRIMNGLLRPAFFRFAQCLLLPLSLPFPLLLLLSHFLKLPQPLFFLLFQSCHFAVPLFRGQ